MIDDDYDDSALLQELIAGIAPGVHYTAAEDGKEALEKLIDQGFPLPDVIFLDLNMPRMDGKECLRQLKADERLKRIPVIIYTTSSQQRDVEETIRGGAVCFISKPLEIHEVESILKEVMRSVPDQLEANLRQLSGRLTTSVVCREQPEIS